MKALWSALVVLALCAGPATGPLFAAEAWVPLGPPGGDIAELVVHPRNPRVLWAATPFRGLYRSTDGGASWSPANQGLTNPVFRALAVAPGNPDVLYLAAGNRSAEIFRSADGGRTWTLVLACSQTPVFGCIPLATLLGLVVHPQTSQTVFAATQQGLYKSVDGGRQWRFQSLPSASSLAFDPRDPQILYAGNSQGVFKSRNGGATWVPANGGMGVNPGINQIAIDPRNPRRLWAGSVNGVYRSTDGGARWRRSGTGALTLVGALALSPGGGPGDLPTVWAGSLEGLFRSLDGGVTWTRSRALRDLRVTAVAVHPSRPGIVWAGARRRQELRAAAGIYKTANGGASWAFSNQGLFEGYSAALAFDPVTPGVLWSASSSGLWRSADGGATWTQRGSGIPVAFALTDVAVDPHDPQTVWAGTTQGVYVSEDAGATWEARREGLNGPGAEPFAPVRSLRIAPSDPSIAYAGTDTGLFRTTDAGRHWTHLPSPDQLDFGLQDILVDPRDPDVVFVAWNDVWVSRDGGSSWQKVPVGSGAAPFRALAADPRDPDVIHAGSEEGVFRSADGGQVWQRVAEFPITFEGDLAAGPTGEVWAARDWSEIYRSPDGLAGWTLIGNAGKFSLLRELEVDLHAPHDAFVATELGLFRHTEGD